jgi:hypothetical protein
MAQTDAKRKATAAYQKRQDNIMIRPSKERGAQIRAAAAAAGMSVQAYILRALEEYERPHHGARLDGENNTMRDYMQSVQTDTETE